MNPKLAAKLSSLLPSCVPGGGGGGGGGGWGFWVSDLGLRVWGCVGSRVWGFGGLGVLGLGVWGVGGGLGAARI